MLILDGPENNEIKYIGLRVLHSISWLFALGLIWNTYGDNYQIGLLYLCGLIIYYLEYKHMRYMPFIKKYICDQRFVHDFRDFIYYVIGTERYDNIDYIIRNKVLNCVSSDILHVDIGADMPV